MPLSGELEPAIGKAGEESVLRSLKRKGFSIIEHNTKGAGATDIHAKRMNGKKNYFLQVKATLSTNELMLSKSEKERLLKRATVEKVIPILAKVYLKVGGLGTGYLSSKPIVYMDLRTGRMCDV